MSVAEAFKSDNLSDLSFAPSAMYALAAPSIPEEARQEAVALAGQAASASPPCSVELATPGPIRRWSGTCRSRSRQT
jgi:hypothetical protein